MPCVEAMSEGFTVCSVGRRSGVLHRSIVVFGPDNVYCGLGGAVMMVGQSIDSDGPICGASAGRRSSKKSRQTIAAGETLPSLIGLEAHIQIASAAPQSRTQATAAITVVRCHCGQTSLSEEAVRSPRRPCIDVTTHHTTDGSMVCRAAHTSTGPWHPVLGRWNQALLRLGRSKSTFLQRASPCLLPDFILEFLNNSPLEGAWSRRSAAV